MPDVAAVDPPNHSFLLCCRRNGEWTDCYVARIGRTVALAEFVEAFYTSWLFRTERWILRWLAARPSTDRQARELAKGQGDSFAAWVVERREQDQLLLTDVRGRTRSWLMVAPGELESTLLYFGSAIVLGTTKQKGTTGMSRIFRLLLVFHEWYSQALLRAARRRLLLRSRDNSKC
jgi:hypothetical protein